ncbi:hypothetical protein CF327_g4189 [Tilletia walkeri]|nr:hypothetical protein CF327_g4189 [Tilletia walkeri]
MVHFNISAVGVVAFVGVLASSSVVTAMPVLKVDAVARQPGSKITPLWGNWGAGGCAWAGPGCGAGRKAKIYLSSHPFSSHDRTLRSIPRMTQASQKRSRPSALHPIDFTA